MEKTLDLARIVGEAQQGREESLEALVTHVRPRVEVYLYRMTLDYHLAQDLTQETMLTLIKSLQFLKTDSHSSLWAWIYRTALGKGQHHFHKQARRQRRRQTTVDHDALDQLAAHAPRDGLSQAQRQELMEAVGTSLETLKLSYRHVLVLRCFEQLSYAEIARVLGAGSELRMRLLFLRAKRALERQLRHRGFGRQYFLSGLSVFATVTALRTRSAVAAPLVTAEVTSTGTVATAIATLMAPCGVVALIILVLTFMIGAVVVPGPGTHIAKVAQALPLVSPSRVIGAHDPNGSGWERVIQLANRPDLRVPADLERLVSDPNADFLLLLPEEHWIEFGFAGPLVDGPGPDIEYHCLTVEKLPSVLLTDGGTRTHQLSGGTRELGEGWTYGVRFDLAQCACPFVPMAIRLEGVGPPKQWEPVTLVNLKARVGPEGNLQR